MSEHSGGCVQSEALAQAEQINALTTTGKYGWLSTLVWNTRNVYLSAPESHFPAKQVQLIVEGFLEEIQTLKASQGGRPTTFTSSTTPHTGRSAQ